MATTNTRTASESIDTAYEQVRDLNEQFLTAARRAGNLSVDTYEKAVDRALELELKMANMSQQDWIKGLINAQADFTRELTANYTAAARSLLK